MRLFFFKVWSETGWGGSPEHFATLGEGGEVRGWPVVVAAPATVRRRRKKSRTGGREGGERPNNKNKGITANSQINWPFK